MATKITDKYVTVDGVMTLVTTETHEIDAAQIIADKEAKLLEIYAELEALKNQQA